MLTKRIVPCLDIRDGRTVKGIRFKEIRDAGDPAELALLYAQQGADEVMLLDITATQEQRQAQRVVVERVAQQVDIPLSVGGGIRSVSDVELLLRSGADKVSVNSAAVQNPALLEELAKNFGCQCIVVAIDAKLCNGLWRVCVAGGKQETELDVFAWAKEAQERGAGEILFTSMEHDGTKNGFAIDVLAELSRVLHIPIIASGGGGTPQHFLDVLTHGCADAALAASVFHFGDITIPSLKQFLHERFIPVRYEHRL